MLQALQNAPRTATQTAQQTAPQAALQTMIVGSDAPAVTEAHLREILDSPADVTLGPTEDGGYYAIACRRVDPRMFDGVRWSTEHTLADTVRAAEACGLTVAFGRECWDIDSPGDLERWRAAGRDALLP